MKNFLKKISQTSLSLIILTVLALISPALAQAEWTNVCGSGYAADWTGRDGVCTGCSRGSQSCSGNYVYKFTCNGYTRECGGNGTTPYAQAGPSSYQSIGNPGCDKTVQIDVFEGANYQNLTDYFVWYTGPCDEPTNTPTPTSTPTPTRTPTPTPTNTPTPTLTPTVTPSISPTPTNTPSPTPTGTPGPSPTTTLTPTATPTTPAHQSACNYLRVTSGDGALVPAKVEFEASASDNQGDIKKYKFYFGDGEYEETSSNKVEHTYEVSGNFEARVLVKDSTGNWITSDDCETKVEVEASPIESHKADCSDLFITAGNGAYAPSLVQFEVTGYDNKGEIQAYKVEFGDDTHTSQADNLFERLYKTPGTYTARGYIKDSQGNWHGGTGSCKKTLYIKTEPITQQPDTGTPTVLSIGSLIAGAFGVYLRKYFAKI